jgi:hypothetical protein
MDENREGLGLKFAANVLSIEPRSMPRDASKPPIRHSGMGIVMGKHRSDRNYQVISMILGGHPFRQQASRSMAAKREVSA